MHARRRRIAALVALALAMSLVAPRAQDEDEAAAPPALAKLHDSFESPRPSWRREQTDAAITLLAHDRSERAARHGQRSERFHFLAELGSAFYYSYPLPKTPLADDLTAELHVRSNRVGMQLFGRVVLPDDLDPDTGQPSYVIVAGTAYNAPDHWQRLELTDLRTAVERQARVLRASTRRPVSLEGAYLERLVINLYGGLGETEVFLDDLTVAPVPVGGRAEDGEGGALAEAEAAEDLLSELLLDPDLGGGEAGVQIDGNRLTRHGLPWVFTAVRAPGADVETLRRAGFDVLVLDAPSDPGLAELAVQSNLLLMPSLAPSEDGTALAPELAAARVADFPMRDAVAFWNLGEHLGSVLDPQARRDELERVRRTIRALRDLDGETPLVTGGVAGLLPNYAIPPRLDLMGVHPTWWGTTRSLADLQRFLTQQRQLTTLQNAGGLFWTFVPCVPPIEVRRAVWGDDVPPSWGETQVQPEQIRLYVYAALAAGYRGFGFRDDAELTRASGRARLIEMSLLNAEIDLFEAIIAEGADPITLLPTYPPDPPLDPSPPGTPHHMRLRVRPPDETPPHPSIRASAITTRDNRGSLLVVADYAAGSQWQPSQMAFNDLAIVVPSVPQSAQAFQISLGGVEVLDRERVPGGTRVVLKDFGPTALVFVTTDLALVERIRAAIEQVRPMAVAMAIEQAQLQYLWVSEINGILADRGYPTRNAADLLAKAQEFLQETREHVEREDYEAAWTKARHVGRPLRILMRGHFLEAYEALARVSDTVAEFDDPDRGDRTRFPRRVSPVASPPLVAFNTLPQHYLWVEWLGQWRFGRNLLPSGTFEDIEALTSGDWTNQSYAYDDIQSTVRSVTAAGGRGQRAIQMTVTPRDPEEIDQLPPFLTHPAAAIRSPAVMLQASQLVRIRVLARMPRPTAAGGGGLIVRDSIGGEPLQFRTTDAIPDWTEIVLYRRAPADGPLTVTLGLAGFGEAFFDDLRIERLEDPYAPPTPPRQARGNRPSRPAGAPPEPTTPTADRTDGNGRTIR